MASVINAANFPEGFPAPSFGFDPVRMNARLSLSADNCTANFTGASTGVSGAPSAKSYATGKLYAEAKLLASANSGSSILGVVDTSLFASNSLLAANGYFIVENGNTNHASTPIAGGAAVAVNAVVRLAIDIAAGKLWLGNTSGWFGGGDPAAGTTPTYSSLAAATYVLFCCMQNTNYSIRFNYGQDAYVSALPSGFSAWGLV